jgi:hypothetical protein
MFILLKKGENHKGILIITHLEKKWIPYFKEIRLTDDYFIYGHWCEGYPKNLRTSLAAYFTDNIFYKNRISDETVKKVNILLKKIGVNILINEKYFDFIHIGRCCKRKNQFETFEIMVKASKLFNKKSILCLIPDDGNDINGLYRNTILKKYNELESNVRKNIYIIGEFNNKNHDYCMPKSLSYEELSLLFNFSKIYIHSTLGFDEARIISQALLGGCVLFCNSGLSGHTKCRSLYKDCVVEYNRDNIKQQIRCAIDKQSKYIFNEKLNDLYNEDITVFRELKKYYNECGFNSNIDLDTFLKKCDKKLWSLKIAGHYNGVNWNVKRVNKYKYGNPTHHIQKEDQLKLFLEFINT